MYIVLKDGTKMEFEKGSSAQDLALQLKFTAPDQAIGVKINGEAKDLSTPLNEGDNVEFIHFDSPEGKEIFWHTSAHVLAQAVLRLWPDAKPTIGPPIDQGFYYDFADLKISDEDFDKIEKEMQNIVKENYKTEREDFASKQEALIHFGENPYKKEIIEGVDDGVGLSAYRQGEFFDLCRGPHMPALGKIKALKVLKTSGAYWRGDAKKEMLTRIYAITFPDRKLLKDYLQFLEEAKKRDHKVVGPRLGLFSLKEEAPGMPFIHPKGMRVWHELTTYLRELLDDRGYLEIKTPSLMTQGLWEQSGHWDYYRENMFTSEIEDRDYAIKPMNCPGCMLYYKSEVHSYRQFPLRVGEIGNVHRYEPSGALSGLFRVRSFHQDDAHIFMMEDQIKDEILNVISLADEIYSKFGLTYHLELSTRPEEGTIGTDEEWEVATNGLKGALDELGRPYVLNEGDGAFYGPKIDFHICDALGRTWQCGTIQLDMALPQKFDLEYTAQDGSRKRPIMIHRAILGSIERFFGILIEHFGGRFPLWLSPHHVTVLTVADRHEPFAEEVAKKLKKAGFITSVDATNESVSKKVRNAQISQINYILTIGDREMEAGVVNLRTRESQVIGEIEVDQLIEKLAQEKNSKSLNSPWSKE